MGEEAHIGQFARYFVEYSLAHLLRHLVRATPHSVPCIGLEGFEEKLQSFLFFRESGLIEDCPFQLQSNTKNKVILKQC